MARPRAAEPKTTISVKLTQRERERLHAVALDVQRGSRSWDLWPSDVNVSDFVRQALFGLISDYEVAVGERFKPDAGSEDEQRAVGAGLLLQQFREAELEAKKVEAERAAQAAAAAAAQGNRPPKEPLGNFAKVLAKQ